MKLARLLAVMLPLVALNAAGAQIFDIGPGNGTSYRAASDGPGQGVTVGTATDLTQIGFRLGSPNGGTLKFFIFDESNTNLLFSTTTTVGSIADHTLVTSNPFSFSLAAGQTYNFGVISDQALDVDYIFPAIAYSENGITISGANDNYANFADPVSVGRAATTMTLALYGTQGQSTVPEPGSMALLGTGLIGLVPMVRRRKSR